jgi:hypothetical protein
MLYDITSDGNRPSRRWATREVIERLHGQILDNTATEIDASLVNSDIAGMTERDFDPHRRTGFQRMVTA